MTRRGRNRLHVWMNDQPVGVWQISSASGHVFHYDDAWLRSAYCRPLSLSLPLRPASDPWRGERVRRYFDSLLPDNPRQRHWLRRQFDTASTDSLDLLAAAGLDCQGALRFSRADRLPSEDELPARALAARELEQLLTSMRQGVAQTVEAGQAPRAVLPGRYDKVALHWQAGTWHLPGAGSPSSHTLHLPVERHEEAGFSLPGSLENAWLCQRVAAAFGMQTPRSELLHIGSQRALAVERTDRRRDADTGRLLALPEEDMCQAFGLGAQARYQVLGAPSFRCMSELLLGGTQPDADRRTLLRDALVMWLLCIFDGHARKLRIRLLPGGRYQLAMPLGVLSAYPLIGRGPGKLAAEQIRMALDFFPEASPRPWPDMAHAFHLQAARAFALPPAAVEDVIDDLSSRALAISASLRRQLPSGFPVAVAEPILQGVVHAARRLREAGRKSGIASTYLA